MPSIFGSVNLNSGNFVMSTPSPPPYCLASLSISCWSSRLSSGEASTSLPPLKLDLDCISWAWEKSLIISFSEVTYPLLPLYSLILSRKSCWIGSETFCRAGAASPKLREAIIWTFWNPLNNCDDIDIFLEQII